MLEEVERVMKMIRDLRRYNEQLWVQNRTELAKGDDARRQMESIKEIIRSILAKIPNRFVPGGDQKDDLEKLASAVTRLIESMNEVCCSFNFFPFLGT